MLYAQVLNAVQCEGGKVNTLERNFSISLLNHMRRNYFRAQNPTGVNASFYLSVLFNAIVSSLQLGKWQKVKLFIFCSRERQRVYCNKDYCAGRKKIARFM